MYRKIRMLVIMICLPVLSAVSTLPRAAVLDIPTVPSMPPDSALALCPEQLQTLPTHRPVEQSEAWQTAISWAEDYHACKTKHAYLAGWVEGQRKITEP